MRFFIDKDGEAGLWTHWQNLNERRRGANGSESYGPPWHGRAWLHWGRSNNCAEVEWNLGSFAFGLSLRHDDEGLHWSVQVPFLSLFFALEGKPFWRHYSREARELSVSVFDWAIWWKTWKDPHSWRSGTPKWRDGSFHIDDFVLGKMRYSSRPLEYRWVEVPMPERTYYGCARLEEATWKRPRWLAQRLVRCEIEMLPGEGVPFPGKGENSWDCGEDACHGQTAPARSISEAVGDLVGSVLRSRVRHGGHDWRPAMKQAAE